MLRAAAALAAAGVIWFASIGSIDVRRINDLGLVSQTPGSMLVAIGLLAVGFVLTLRLPRDGIWLSLVAIGLLVLMVHGLPTFVEGAPRFPVAYLHAGFTEVIADEGRLLPGLDARFSWPIFFALGALVTRIAGLENAIDLQPWAPIVANLLWVPPVIVIYRSLTQDWRLILTATFVFLAANWIGQDYYSPQAFNVLIYLTTIAILLRWFRRPVTPRWAATAVNVLDRRLPWLRAPMRSLPPRADVQPVPAPPATRAALVIVVILLTLVSAASHQLTPFATLGAAMVLVVLGRLQLRGLPVLMAVIIGTWISYMTVAFLAGNLASLFGDVLAAGETASETVTQRIVGSPMHVFVVQLRLVATLAFWLLAAAGGLRRFRLGYLDFEVIALAAAPFTLILLQAYGGEMLLRVYLFSMPFMAFLAAALFVPSPDRSFGRWSTALLGVVLTTLVAALLVTKHGNERAELLFPDEVTAAARLYAAAPDGSTIASVNAWSPLRFTAVDEYEYPRLGFALTTADPAAIAAVAHQEGPCGYLYLSRGQQAAEEMYNGLAPVAWEGALDRLISSGEFDVGYTSEDATVLITADSPPRCDIDQP